MEIETNKSLKKTKWRGSVDPISIKSKLTKLTRTGSKIVGKFVTESSIYYKPSFMIVAGKDPLFKIRADY